jgi:hypothetical protein
MIADHIFAFALLVVLVLSALGFLRVRQICRRVSRGQA